MTDNTLTEIETRLASATAGPWRAGLVKTAIILRGVIIRDAIPD